MKLTLKKPSGNRGLLRFGEGRASCICPGEIEKITQEHGRATSWSGRADRADKNEDRLPVSREETDATQVGPIYNIFLL